MRRTTIAISLNVAEEVDRVRGNLDIGSSRAKFIEFLAKNSLKIIEKHGLDSFMRCGSAKKEQKSCDGLNI